MRNHARVSYLLETNHFGAHLLFRINVFQPFKVKSFRFQWPADLMTSWAFEMEILILGWYVIVETQSVLSLTLFASLQWLGTLLAPYLGALGDRLSRRTLLCSLRLIYLIPVSYTHLRAHET